MGRSAAAWRAAPAIARCTGSGWPVRELLRCLVPLSARRGETLRDQLERLAQVRAAVRECARLEAQLAREKQFNRKVKINCALREAVARLQADQ